MQRTASGAGECRLRLSLAPKVSISRERQRVKRGENGPRDLMERALAETAVMEDEETEEAGRRPGKRTRLALPPAIAEAVEAAGPAPLPTIPTLNREPPHGSC